MTAPGAGLGGGAAGDWARWVAGPAGPRNRLDQERAAWSPTAVAPLAGARCPPGAPEADVLALTRKRPE
jgi:hypothetical protein